MNIRFWGVRGSIPAPLAPSRVKSKISAIIEQITPEDLVSAESRERFLAGLPPWLFGTVGGNSPCITVDFGSPKECFVFDCGSGIREFGMVQAAENRRSARYHIFFSHFHWDHILGLPFFAPGYDPTVRLDFYSPVPNVEKILGGQMAHPYFPVTLDAMGAVKNFHHLRKELHISGRTVNFKKMNHPGDSYAFSVTKTESGLYTQQIRNFRRTTF